MLSKEETEKAYWEGYIQKQNEAVEICKQCKYRKKARELETRQEELQEENNKLERANKTYINSIQSITPVLLEYYIPKDIIREKIKEMQKEYKEALEENSTKAFILKCQITILEELLNN